MPPRRLPYLPLKTVLDWEPVAHAWSVSAAARGPGGFLAIYRKAGGIPSHIPVVWQIKRERFLLGLLDQIQVREGSQLFDSDDQLPTRRALSLVMWGYFPRPVLLARSYATLQEDSLLTCSRPSFPCSLTSALMTVSSRRAAGLGAPPSPPSPSSARSLLPGSHRRLLFPSSDHTPRVRASKACAANVA
jgi:hypothetical protein